MTTGPALTETQLPPKENSFSSTRLLSKIARSPTTSRRHRPIPSQGSDGIPDPLPVTQGAAHSRRNQPRPTFQRQISAPDTSVLPLSREEEEEEVKRHSDATGLAAEQAKAMLNSQPLHPQQHNNNNNTTAAAKGNAPATMFSAPLVSEYYPVQHTNPNIGPNGVSYMFQQLHELSQKRIATLQYMKRAHEGKLFWFNTVHFSKSDVSRLPSYAPGKLARRAMNYFLLGLSIPAVLDIHPTPYPGMPPSASIALALDYLKSLNTLLTEFENYQEKHPVDGGHFTSLGRARLPSMFKRSATISRPRKSSSAPFAEIGAQISPPAVPETPHAIQHSSNPSIDTSTTWATTATANSSASTLANPSFGAGVPMNNNFSTTATFPPPGPSDAPNSSLLPNEAPYTHLLTPPLPFAPDFYTVFSTLCDVLIDTYQRLLQIIHSPSACNATTMELFNKTDARIRRVMVGGIIKEFGDAAKDNARKELSGVQKIVLGPLMG